MESIQLIEQHLSIKMPCELGNFFKTWKDGNSLVLQNYEKAWFLKGATQLCTEINGVSFFDFYNKLKNTDAFFTIGIDNSDLLLLSTRGLSVWTYWHSTDELIDEKISYKELLECEIIKNVSKTSGSDIIQDIVGEWHSIKEYESPLNLKENGTLQTLGLATGKVINFEYSTENNTFLFKKSSTDCSHYKIIELTQDKLTLQGPKPLMHIKEYYRRETDLFNI